LKKRHPVKKIKTDSFEWSSSQQGWIEIDCRIKTIVADMFFQHSRILFEKDLLMMSPAGSIHLFIKRTQTYKMINKIP
jgi:hypothetical protein